MNSTMIWDTTFSVWKNLFIGGFQNVTHVYLWFSFLNVTSLLHMSCVNKRFYNLCHDQTLWKCKCIESFAINECTVVHLENEKIDWYLWYRSMYPKLSSMTSVITDLKNKLTKVSVEIFDFACMHASSSSSSLSSF